MSTLFCEWLDRYERPEIVKIDSIRRLTFEAGQLRRERDNGFHHIQEDPESVAEHCHRASVLGYLLASHAKLTEVGFEDIDPNYVTTLIVFHDLHETRTGDDDLIQKRYCKIDRVAALHDQLSGLGMVGKTLERMWLEVEHRSTPSGTLAKDAEVLERAFTAHELVTKGNLQAQSWIDAVGPRLKTETAKRLFETLKDSDPYEWWKRLLGEIKPADMEPGVNS